MRQSVLNFNENFLLSFFAKSKAAAVDNICKFVLNNVFIFLLRIISIFNSLQVDKKLLSISSSHIDSIIVVL